MMKRPFGIWLLSTGLLLLFIGMHASVSATDATLIAHAPTSVTYFLALVGAAAAIWGLGLVSMPPDATR